MSLVAHTLFLYINLLKANYDLLKYLYNILMRTKRSTIKFLTLILLTATLPFLITNILEHSSNSAKNIKVLINSCQKNTETNDCLKKVYEVNKDKYSINDWLNIVFKMTKSDNFYTGNCHDIAYSIGENLQNYNVIPNTFFTELCGSGLLQGYLTKTTRLSNITDISKMKTLSNFCNKITGKNILTSIRCYHGIGMALMEVPNKNSKEAYQLCEYFPDIVDESSSPDNPHIASPLYNCATGVAMNDTSLVGTDPKICNFNNKIVAISCLTYLSKNVNRSYPTFIRFLSVCNNIGDKISAKYCRIGLTRDIGFSPLKLSDDFQICNSYPINEVKSCGQSVITTKISENFENLTILNTCEHEEFQKKPYCINLLYFMNITKAKFSQKNI